MQVHLRKKKLKDGRYSYYLDIYKDGVRSYEFLKLYTKKGAPDYKEISSLAAKVKSQRLIELSNDEYDQISAQKKKASFIKYYEQFVKTKKKWSNYAGAFNYLKQFAGKDITFKQINTNWLEDFAEFLSKETKLKPNSAHLYYRKIREVLNKASKEGFIRSDIIKSAKNPPREKVNRGYLELFEIEKLFKVEMDRPEIKRAFLFSCFTGLRQSDIRNLKWKDISNNKINIIQQKTSDEFSIPLSKTALNLLKNENVYPMPEMKVFNIPTDRTTINRALTRWFKKAGIDKKAFYHLSRHTFATLNLTSGNEIYTVSKLLGHKNLKTTEIYAKIIDDKKKEAINNLPEIQI